MLRFTHKLGSPAQGHTKQGQGVQEVVSVGCLVHLLQLLRVVSAIKNCGAKWGFKKWKKLKIIIIWYFTL